MYAVSIAPNSNHLHAVAAWKEASIAEEASIPLEYEVLNEVFSMTRALAVPEHGPQDLTLDLIEGKEP
jgi:hypothetical protein